MTGKDNESRPTGAPADDTEEASPAYDLAVAVLREDLDGALSSVESDWADFDSLMWARIDDTLAEPATTAAFDTALGALKEDVNGALSSVEPDWADFDSLMWARIDETVPELASTPTLDVALGALKEDVDDAVTAREGEWADMDALVWARIDEAPEDALAASPQWSQIAAALREEHAVELGELEARHGEWNDGFSLRWAEDADQGAATVGDMLRSEVASAVDDKTHAWSAFAHQVMWAIERARPVGNDDNAMAMLRDEVESELDALAPRFDSDFREGVERRIFREGQTVQPWWRRWSDAFTDWLQPSPGLGLAAAAAAAVVLVVVRPTSVPEPTPDAGQVSISAVRFDGTVTVMPDDGIAVVWVTGDAS